jgi:DNA-directed RNA polymerase beta subunit
LNSSQWGVIDPIDTPDGGNIGLHKHMSISTYITSGTSSHPIIKWLRVNTPMRILLECSPEQLGSSTKIIVNGKWIGIIDNPIEFVNELKLYRRNGIIPIYTSISFNYEQKEVYIYTDAGRLSRPIYYIENDRISFDRKEVKEKIDSGNVTWEEIVSGFMEKADENFKTKNNRIYDIKKLYTGVGNSKIEIIKKLLQFKSVVDYIDTSEEESALIATNLDDLQKSKWYTHLEIDPSLILGVMGNMIIYPENNPVTRNSFSCGQSKQAVSVYHSNYQMRIDKTGVVLNYGQIPLIKSRYLEYINNEEQPYGVNAIVAIMCYGGYNVEDAILINEASIHRGIFRTTYYSSYETREESSKVTGSTNSKFLNIEKNNVIGKKQGYDYSFLDEYGLVKENTEINDKIILIGKVNSSVNNKDVLTDDSVKTKKGQLGFVDKSFITLGEEGFNVAKVRVREERLPAIGDKMASRAGQKGTLGLIIPEEDMPFTDDGIRPDLIINPHAIPSRMTIGQIVESLFGKVCVNYGAFGDCTAFQVKGSNYSTYAPMLVESGFHSSGNQILYNGMNGFQLAADIYIGPTYYMRLKHMVKDKINYRARGPNTVLTRQPVQGRANDGGLRIGEMERDGVLAHGMSYFLNESFMVRGEKQDYYIAVCNKTGSIAIYNQARNLFLSPYADGPIKFNTNPDNSQSIINLSRFGRSFSILRVPYAFKLLIQELLTMNVQMRIITEENVDQLLSMSYSNNINKLLHNDKDIAENIKEINENIVKALNSTPRLSTNFEEPQIPEPVKIDTSAESIPYAVASPAYEPGTPDINEYNNTSPAYVPNFDESNKTSSTPDYYKRTVENGITHVRPKYDFPDDLGYYYLNLTEEQKKNLLNKPFEQKVQYLEEVKQQKLKELADKSTPVSEEKEPLKTGILDVEQAKPQETESNKSETSESNSGKKTVTIQEPEKSSSETTSSDGTRKITL